MDFPPLLVKGCSRTFYGPSGEIMSPNYPSKYNTNLDCVYKIQVGSRRRVKLVFVDFWLENGDTRTTCDYDYLEIRDGRNSSKFSKSSMKVIQ